jgi:hypothetical protein
VSRLTDLIAEAKAKDPALGRELEREFKVLSARRSFGLNFERHRPESVDLPGRLCTEKYIRRRFQIPQTKFPVPVPKFPVPSK